MQLRKPMCLEPVLHNKRSHHNERPVRCKEELPPLAATREKLWAAPKTQNSHKKKKNSLKRKKKFKRGTIVCDMWKWCKIQSSMSVNKVLLKHGCPWTYVLSVTAFILLWQSGIVVTGTIWPPKPTMFIIWFFTENCWQISDLEGNTPANRAVTILRDNW